MTSTGFLPESLVLMTDETRWPCRNLLRGDVVSGGHRIVCVVKTLVSYADIVRLWTSSSPTAPPGGFTAQHPVLHEGVWVHPTTIGPVTRVYTDAVYNFVLDGGHTLDINGITTCTIGHSEAGILTNLSVQPGWTSGYVTLNNSHHTRFIDADTNEEIREIDIDIPYSLSVNPQ
jgi:hypothetical protein